MLKCQFFDRIAPSFAYIKVPNTMRTTSLRHIDAKEQWFLVDASECVLGRMASRIALLLQGKGTAQYTPHVDQKIHVIVVNAKSVKVTGNKEQQKKYYRHTGYPGGIKHKVLSEIRESDPSDLVHKAVKGMLPKGPLGNVMRKNLKVYADATHPHAAQQPKTIEL